MSIKKPLIRKVSYKEIHNPEYIQPYTPQDLVEIESEKEDRESMIAEDTRVDIFRTFKQNPFILPTREGIEILLDRQNDFVFSLSDIDLNTVAARCLFYILEKYQENYHKGDIKDYVFIHKTQLMKTLHKSSWHNVMLAFDELQKSSFIARKSTNEYWINPHRLFFGSPLYFYLKFELIMKTYYPDLYIKYRDLKSIQIKKDEA